ncbi:MAG: VOC family protein [Thermodesulfobacteriota bacterium]
MNHLKVKNVDKSVDFYVKYLNFDLIERAENSYAILVNSDFNLKLVLENKQNDQLRSEPLELSKPITILEAKHKSFFAKIYKSLVQAGIHVYPVDNVVSWSIHFSDPDNNNIELYLDRRSETFMKYSSNGVNIDMERERIFSVLH